MKFEASGVFCRYSVTQLQIALLGKEYEMFRFCFSALLNGDIIKIIIFLALKGHKAVSG